MKRKILVIGSGGREHAIAHAFNKSQNVKQVYVLPGNSGMEDVASCVPIDPLDFNEIVNFCQKEKIDLVFVGPELLLSKGIADVLKQNNILVFGPSQKAAQLEASKSFAKDLMADYNIPTAHYKTVFNRNEAYRYLSTHPAPIVIKADGLMAGKGVTVAMDDKQVHDAIEAIYSEDSIQSPCVIEEYLEGEEFSLMCLVHEDQIIPLPIARDHKRAFDQDLGPNTGGMGAFCPHPLIPQTLVDEAIDKIVKPIINAMKLKGIPYTGVLYAGLMATQEGVKTIEFNVRFGDPETEVILPRLITPLDEVLLKLMKHESIELVIDHRACLGVVLASRGYPGKTEKQRPILNLDRVEATIYHMGTSKHGSDYFNQGGRVLCITTLADTLDEAKARVYQDLKKIDAPQCFYRQDIGAQLKSTISLIHR